MPLSSIEQRYFLGKLKPFWILTANLKQSDRAKPGPGTVGREANEKSKALELDNWL